VRYNCKLAGAYSRNLEMLTPRTKTGLERCFDWHNFNMHEEQFSHRLGRLNNDRFSWGHRGSGIVEIIFVCERSFGKDDEVGLKARGFVYERFANEYSASMFRSDFDGHSGGDVSEEDTREWFKPRGSCACPRCTYNEPRLSEEVWNPTPPCTRSQRLGQPKWGRVEEQIRETGVDYADSLARFKDRAQG
jgi:hypothetical protein